MSRLLKKIVNLIHGFEKNAFKVLERHKHLLLINLRLIYNAKTIFLTPFGVEL